MPNQVDISKENAMQALQRGARLDIDTHQWNVPALVGPRLVECSFTRAQAQAAVQKSQHTAWITGIRFYELVAMVEWTLIYFNILRSDDDRF